MTRIFYDDEVKSEAISRFFRGESSEEIAITMNIHSGDLIRKWVQLYRKKHNLPADFRESDFDEEENEILLLRGEIISIKEQRDIAIKALCLVAKGKLKDWHQILNFLEKKNYKK